LETDPGLYQGELSETWREILRSQRSTLTALFRDNVISEETYDDLVCDVDSQLENPENPWSKPAEEDLDETSI
jgi:hypothetical protein